MRISASISSVHRRQISSTVKELDQAGVDFYHLDSVENREIFAFAKMLRSISQTPMDLHLITSDPVKYWDDIRESGVVSTVIQLESLHSSLFIPQDLRGKVGLAILASSSPELFRPYEKVASCLLIMTTTPGYSGGKFQQEQFANILRFRFAYPKIPLIVDGGVTGEIAAILNLIGIPQVVSGSYLFSESSVFETVNKLKYQPAANRTIVDFFLPEPELLKTLDLRLPEQIQFINHLGDTSLRLIPDNWLNSIGAKTVAMNVGPVQTIWVDERVNVETLSRLLPSIPTIPQLLIAVNQSDEVSGLVCLSTY